MTHQAASPLGGASRLLVLRPDNIGDVVMTGPALRALKRALPGAHLTLLASEGGATAAPLLPWLDDVIATRTLWQDLGHLPFDPGREWALAERLRAGDYDAAVILTSFSQSPHAPALLCALAGIPIRIGESKEDGQGVLTLAAPPQPDEIHQVERNLRLIEAAGVGVGHGVEDRRLAIRVPPADAARATALLAERGLPPGASYLLLCPWASCPARTFFPERFAQAARLMAEATGWPVVVCGAPRDRERSRPLVDALGAWGIDLTGLTTVAELASLVAGARLVLANDSLPMHLADATGTPGLILYSGTELESQWRPRHTAHRLLRRPTPCSPCYHFICPYRMECLDFPAAEVAEAGLALLAEADSGRRLVRQMTNRERVGRTKLGQTPIENGGPRDYS